MPKKSFFIVFEGIDKSGKEAQAIMLKEWLREEGFEIVLFGEPNYKSSVGEIIGGILKREVAMPESVEFQRMYIFDRALNILSLLKPCLERGGVAIWDRYFLSTVAYGMLSGRPAEDFIKLHYDVLGPFMILPDITIFVDISADESLRRMKKMHASPDFFEKKQKNLEKVRMNYLKILERKDIGETARVNGEKPREEVFREVKKIVRSKLNIG